MKNECQKLDGYLADDLPAEQSLRFEQHFPTCDTCRDVIRQQRWIDELLQSPVRLHLEPTPIHLTLHSQGPVRQRRRGFQLAACGMAAAILVAVSFMESKTQQHEKTNTAAAANQNSALKSLPLSVPSTSSPATFVSDDSSIALSLESISTDVTVVQVFPTLETERHWHRELVLQNTQSKSNGG